MLPAWLPVISLASIGLGSGCAIVIAVDEWRHPQHMWNHECGLATHRVIRNRGVAMVLFSIRPARIRAIATALASPNRLRSWWPRLRRTAAADVRLATFAPKVWPLPYPRSRSGWA